MFVSNVESLALYSIMRLLIVPSVVHAVRISSGPGVVSKIADMSLDEVAKQLISTHENLFDAPSSPGTDSDLAAADRRDRDSEVPRQTGMLSSDPNYLDQLWNWMKGVASIQPAAFLPYPHHSSVYLNQYAYRRTSDPSDSTDVNLAGDIVVEPQWTPEKPIHWELWPHGDVVEFNFDEADSCTRTVVHEAMIRYEEATNGCIRFVESQNKSADVLRITSSSDGCFSTLGYKSAGNVVNLGVGCRNVGTVMHLLGHTLGLAHEDQRPDARDYVVVKSNNIDVYGMSASNEVDPVNSTKYMYVFTPLSGTKTEWEQQIAALPYEYGSLMHNSKFVYAVDISKDATLTGKTGAQFDDLFGNRGVITERDARLLNEMYACQRLPIRVVDRYFARPLYPGLTYDALNRCLSRDSAASGLTAPTSSSN